MWPDISLKFKPQDAWIGAYWERGREFVNDGPVYRFFRVWICLVPMLPIKIEVRRVV